MHIPTVFEQQNYSLIIYNQAQEIMFNILQFMREEAVEGIKFQIKGVSNVTEGN